MARFSAVRAASGAIVALLIALAAPGWPQQIALTIDDITGAGFSAQGVSLRFNGTGGDTDLAIASLTFGTQVWKNVKLQCPSLQLARYRLECPAGMLQLDEKIPLSFSYSTNKRALNVALKPAKDETWRITSLPAARGADLEVIIDGGKAQRLATWLPADAPRISAGIINGSIRYGGDGKMAAQLTVANLGFSDTQGLRAGEKITVALDMQAAPQGEQLAWRANAAWTAGEAFWQPLYLKAANQRIDAEGRWDGKQLHVDRGSLVFPDIGNAAFSGSYDPAAATVTQASIKTSALKAAPLYQQILKSFLSDTTFSDLRTDGEITLSAEANTQGVRAVDVQLDHFSFEDNARRFALFEVNGRVPWRADTDTRTEVTIKGGELLQMPVGSFTLPLLMNGMRFELKQLSVPLLDGHIDIRNFVARAGTASWYWQFGGEIGAISMDKFTQALGLPEMHGTLSGTIPMVRSIRSTLRVDGAFLFRIFDGTVEAKNVALLDLFGKAPRVQGDVVMRNLDLGLVTRAFSFGSITGRVDAQVEGLELVNWQPVKFNARLMSSAGDYPRKISQAAVQNISALGGAGAAAAIQRSFLRFFEQFGYDKLGWGCRLANGVCEMSGVENAPQGYVLVKGGGIPSITVMGYNRQVNWQELLQRLKRITDGNLKPVVE